jgi:hypothetical protein
MTTVMQTDNCPFIIQDTVLSTRTTVRTRNTGLVSPVMATAQEVRQLSYLQTTVWPGHFPDFSPQTTVWPAHLPVLALGEDNCLTSDNCLAGGQDNCLTADNCLARLTFWTFPLHHGSPLRT